MAKAGSTEKVVREIRRHTRRRFSAEEKIRIVLDVTLNVYEGMVDVAAPITPTAELFGPDYSPPRESVELDVVVEYQACSETVCYLPEVARLSVSVPTSALVAAGR